MLKKLLISGFVFLGLISCQQQEKKYKFTGVKSGKVMTLSYNRPLQTVSKITDGECRWSFIRFADSTVQVISRPSGQALEVFKLKNQVLPYIADSDSANICQRFRLVKNDDGSVTLVSVYSGYAVDISESEKADFAVITTWRRENNPNQKWTLVAEEEDFLIVSTLNQKYLAITPAVTEAGANIGQWPFSGRKEQAWILEKQNNGSFRIKNELSGMYLQDSDGSLSLKNNVQQSPDAGSPRSHWLKTEAKYGNVIWKNVATGLCLDVRDGVSYDGANIMTYTCSGTPNQLWRVEEIR